MTFKKTFSAACSAVPQMQQSVRALAPEGDQQLVEGLPDFGD
jgi:hypothetical protein